MSVTFACDPAYVWQYHDLVAGDLAFDVGANGGITARQYAQHFGRVVAFEPGSSYVDLVTDKPSNITPVNQAVSDVVGTVTFDVRVLADRLGELTTGDSLVGSWGDVTGHCDVHATTLDAAAAFYGQPDYIKIDTEGHEGRVVAGGDLIFEARPRLFIEVHAAANVGPILERLQPHYRELRLLTHDGYGRTDPARAEHFYLLAGI